jgi:hypothetical protein
MTVDDRKFYEKWDEYHHLRIKELFEEAEVETVTVDRSRYWEHRPLLAELAEKVAQVAVARHNDLLRAEQVARQQASRLRTNAYVDRPFMSSHAPKKLKDLAHKKKMEIDPATKSAPEPAAYMSESRSEQKKAGSRPSRNLKNMAPKDEDTDSGYSTGRFRSSKSSMLTSTSHAEDSNKDDSDLPVDRCKYRSSTRNGSKHESSKASSIGSHTESFNTTKRARPTEDKDEHSERPSKKVKGPSADVLSTRVRKTLRARRSSAAPSYHDEQTRTKFEGAKTRLPRTSSTRSEGKANNPSINHQTGTTRASLSQASVAAITSEAPHKRKSRSSSDDDEDSKDMPSKRAKHGTKRRARVLAHESDDTEDSESASSTEDDLPRNNSRSNYGLKVRKTTKEKQLRGVSTSERVPGLPYTQYADGSWKLVKRAQPARRKLSAAQSRYNYIK